MQDGWGLLSVATPDGCKRLFKINKEQFLSPFILREVHLLKYPGTHWAFTKYLSSLRGHSDPPVDTMEFSGSWHLHGKTGMSAEESSINILTGASLMASLGRAHMLLKEVIFCHNNWSLKSLVLKDTYNKIRSSRVVCIAFQEKPRPLSFSSAQSLLY